VNRKLWIALAAFGSLAAASCGSDAKSSTSPAASAAPKESTVPSAPSDTTAPSEAPADTSGSSTAPAAGGDPIVIGYTADLTSQMAPVDGPPVAAAKIRVDQINAEGGVNGRKLELKVVDTKLDPAATKADAADLIKGGAKVMFVTCDVDFATPAIEESINAGLLTIAPCIGTDQMGPKRFGDKGKLAFSIGNVAQDEGAAMAELAIKRGYKTATVITDQLLVYFQNVCQSFTKRFEEKGGKVVSQQSFTTGDDSVNAVPSAVAAETADVLALCTFAPSLNAAVGGVRDAGVKTPFVSPWSGDGSFWIPTGLNDFTFVTYASAFGDDPVKAVNDLAAEIGKGGQPPATGGFVTGAAAVDALVAALKATNGDTDGAKLAAEMEKFTGLETISGKISFSPTSHSVTGREYRIVDFKDGKPAVTGAITASSPADIG
jgi:branched-chain amino acid transport system substrate-binding protein